MPILLPLLTDFFQNKHAQKAHASISKHKFCNIIIDKVLGLF